MRLGTVKYYDDEKGLGLITPSNGGKDLIVSAKGLIDKIQTQNIVLFDLNFAANNVEVVKVTVLKS
ncbi:MULTISPECIES: cold-shock protein [Pedobacter]|jgi:CspA family cold shock protein|uniref:cold-shock protein n=1 Tax=Pedobacter TaxID=84567 RepID=UPI000E21D557|nr:MULTISPECIES: cold shock domain-containing protein [Pedobacter]AZI27580.1 cold-shock protein [Pedobacter sp. G11]MDQ1139369.1 CspA family cold shock protein [Pedobacter agri]RZJ77704.1 MAG: cold-shock protein [Flavobacterium sp.]